MYVLVASVSVCFALLLADKIFGNPTGNPKVSAANLVGRLNLRTLPLFHHHSGSALSLAYPRYLAVKIFFSFNIFFKTVHCTY